MACAWGVHLYTALGAAAGLLAIYFAAEHDFAWSFIAMGIAIIIDSSDGALARLFDVKQRVPTFDGSLLDNIVDYLTYVLAPVFLMLRAGILEPGRGGYLVGGLVMVASGYGFKWRTDTQHQPAALSLFLSRTQQAETRHRRRIQESFFVGVAAISGRTIDGYVLRAYGLLKRQSCTHLRRPRRFCSTLAPVVPYFPTP